MSTTIPLVLFLLLALAIVLGNRRIGWSSGEFWAAEMIALCLFLVGRLL